MNENYNPIILNIGDKYTEKAIDELLNSENNSIKLVSEKSNYQLKKNVKVNGDIDIDDQIECLWHFKKNEDGNFIYEGTNLDKLFNSMKTIHSM